MRTSSQNFENAAPRALLARMFEAAVTAALPSQVLAPHLPEPPAGRLVILGAGKAAGALAQAAEAHYLDQLGLPLEKITGLFVTRHGYGAPTRHLRIIEAGHPIPDAAGLTATAQTLELAHEAGPDDIVVVLLSGGGSANWVAPAPGITLDDKQRLTKALLRSGATISEINTVRKHLSRIKGGNLARLAAPARVLTLAISDVPGDDMSLIASGPTVPDPSTCAEAHAILDRYGIVPEPAIERLLADGAVETPKPGDAIFARCRQSLIAAPRQSLDAVAKLAREAGYDILDLGSDLEGEARVVARKHAALALEALNEKRRLAILSGGELTVTVTGDGRGGPNQEYALALAIDIKGVEGITAMAADTDGTDGGGGADNDPAGAIVDGKTLRGGRDAVAFLDQNDATGFLEETGDLMVTGPTRTNVNDVRVILVDPPR